MLEVVLLCCVIRWYGDGGVMSVCSVVVVPGGGHVAVLAGWYDWLL